MESIRVDRFSAVTLTFQVLLIFLYGIFTKYTPEDVPDDVPSPSANHYYPMFQDVHVMMFIGFGFLMTFLKRYGFSAISLNFMVSIFSLQWGILTINFFRQVSAGSFQNISLSMTDFISGDYSTAACLISLGAVLGKTTPLQTVIFIFFELIFYAMNATILFDQLDANDMGGGMYIHSFGAYFGLTLSLILSPKEVKGEKHPLESSVYHSDLFSMIGTIFLWMYWPSFNAAEAPGSAQQRVIINTIVALCASCGCVFATSSIFRPGHKLDMVDIQNATLAGGVAVGTSSDLFIQPWGAMMIGAVAGTWSVIGFNFIQPFLLQRIGLHDTCGVNNLHGMPGIIGAIASAIAIATANEADYGDYISNILENDRTAGVQALFQIAGVAVSIGMGVVGGMITGWILNLSFFDNQRKVFDDSEHFGTPVEFAVGDIIDAEDGSVNEEHGDRSPLIKRRENGK